MPYSLLLRAGLMLAVSTFTVFAQTPDPAPAGQRDPTVPQELPHVPLDHMPESAGKATEIPLTNGNFENGLEGWTVEGPASVFTTMEGSAAMGAKGLLVTGDSATEAKLTSKAYPVQPGHIYGAQFWGRDRMPGINFLMVFSGDDGKPIDPGLIKGVWPHGGAWAKGHFENYALRAVAPQGATQVKLVIGGNKGAVGDVDDVQMWEFSLAETPIPINVAALEAEIAANPYRGKPLPKLVIKLDDLTKVNGAWQRVYDFVKPMGVKVNFGIICNSLETGTPEYFKWINDMKDSGIVEFWCHGYDHGGTPTQEFKMPYDYQKKHMDDCERLAKEKLGWPFEVFGAPFNAINDDTVRVMSETPEMKIWMYGDPAKPAGKLVLDRMGCVNTENPTLLPDFSKFLAGYAHNRGYPYFCMQGHPAQWDDPRYDNFQKVINFLVQQKVKFMHATEMTAQDVVVPAYEATPSPAPADSTTPAPAAPAPAQ